MSKAEILAELPKLSPQDREEILAKLSELAADVSPACTPLCAHPSHRKPVPLKALATRGEWKSLYRGAKRSADKWLAENP